MQGKLIVIDGIDGSGKKTQSEILIKKIAEKGIPVQSIDFPQYGKKSAGPIEEYLNGTYGSPEEVGAYRASIFYAIDRYDASFQIKEWLNQGQIVIANRYVTANMGHQGAKITNEQDLNDFLYWLENLEYEIFQIPKPDLNIILQITPQTGQKLIDQKGHRDYLHGQKRDIHEADLKHLQDAQKTS